MRTKAFKIARFLLIFVVMILISGLGIKTFYLLQGPALQPWHTFEPDELSVEALGEASWQDYLDHEQKIYDDIITKVVDQVPPSQRTAINRYFKESIIFPPKLKNDWNRSYTLIPEGTPKGGLVVLHGLTDSPFSLRHVAQLYYEKGFAVVGIRLPGHGTVPGGLNNYTWQQMTAATELAVREARRLAPEGAPLHIVGFSNGGALAIKYGLDALENKKLPQADKITLISPMIGITRMAPVAEIIALPSRIPGLEKAGWLGITPEFNPFKYNSFPVNGVRQARLLINNLNDQIVRLYQSGQIKALPKIQTFQSVADFTVSTPSIINNLYAYLPPNGSELVLFDVNQATIFSPLMRPAFSNMINRILPDLPQPYKITVIVNAAAHDLQVVEKTIPAGEKESYVRPLNMEYPPNIFSLSHMALPFPVTDQLYGLSPLPGTEKDFGMNLSTMISAKGERGVLLINMNALMRIASNPFFTYLTDRLGDNLDGQKKEVPAPDPKTSYAPGGSKMSVEEFDSLSEDLEYYENHL